MGGTVAAITRADHQDVAEAARLMSVRVDRAVKSGDTSALEGGEPELDAVDRRGHEWADRIADFWTCFNRLSIRDQLTGGPPTPGMRRRRLRARGTAR